MDSKKILTVIVCLILVINISFHTYNVFIGLYNATALQGLSGIILIIMGVLLTIIGISKVHTLFD